MPTGLPDATEPPWSALKPAASSAASAASALMPDVTGTRVGSPSMALRDGSTKSSHLNRSWIACIAAAHIGPAKPEPDTS